MRKGNKKDLTMARARDGVKRWEETDESLDRSMDNIMR